MPKKLKRTATEPAPVRTPRPLSELAGWPLVYVLFISTIVLALTGNPLAVTLAASATPLAIAIVKRSR